MTSPFPLPVCATCLPQAGAGLAKEGEGARFK